MIDHIQTLRLLEALKDLHTHHSTSALKKRGGIRARNTEDKTEASHAKATALGVRESVELVKAAIQASQDYELDPPRLVKTHPPGDRSGWTCPNCGRGNSPMLQCCPCVSPQPYEITCGGTL